MRLVVYGPLSRAVVAGMGLYPESGVVFEARSMKEPGCQ